MYYKALEKGRGKEKAVTKELRLARELEERHYQWKAGSLRVFKKERGGNRGDEEKDEGAMWEAPQAAGESKMTVEQRDKWKRLVEKRDEEKKKVAKRASARSEGTQTQPSFPLVVHSPSSP